MRSVYAMLLSGVIPNAKKTETSANKKLIGYKKKKQMKNSNILFHNSSVICLKHNALFTLRHCAVYTLNKLFLCRTNQYLKLLFSKMGKHNSTSCVQAVLMQARVTFIQGKKASG